MGTSVDTCPKPEKVSPSKGSGRPSLVRQTASGKSSVAKLRRRPGDQSTLGTRVSDDIRQYSPGSAARDALVSAGAQGAAGAGQGDAPGAPGESPLRRTHPPSDAPA